MRTHPAPSQSSPIFGLIAWLDKTRIQLPLRAVDCRFRVTGEVAVVEMDQIFQQSASRSLDVTYSFPLPHGAATYRCEMHVNGRVIRAKVMEQEAARRVAQEQKAQGHRTALVEVDRENLFTLELGNLAPGDTILIRFAYFQTVERLGAQLSLRIPFCPGVRYIPGNPLLRNNRGKGTEDDTDQVPDASRITPPRIDASHPDVAGVYLDGTLMSAEVDLGTLSSPTHPAIIRPTGTDLQVRLAEAASLPDCDFVLRWNEVVVSETQGRTDATQHAGNTYALMRLRAPQQSAAAEDWEQDVYFLVDRSGSMQGEKWNQCARALHAFVRELGARDRVWITCFESGRQDFSEAPLLRDALLADKNFQNIAALGAGGGTNLLPALNHVLKAVQRHSAERRKRIVLITDGQVGNESEILQGVSQYSDLPVYCFGIDTAVNDSFLRQFSERTGGRCALMTPDDDIPAAVRALAESLRRPVLTGLKLSPGWQLPAPGETLPDLHAGEVLSVAVRHDAAAASSSELPLLEVSATTPSGESWKNSSDIHLDASNLAPQLLWVKQRISSLLASLAHTEAIALAVEHNLLCPGASFIAYDEAEKVPVAQLDVYQPSMGLRKRSAPLSQTAPLGKYMASKKAFTDIDGVPVAGAAAAVVGESIQRQGWQSLRTRFHGNIPGLIAQIYKEFTKQERVEKVAWKNVNHEWAATLASLVVKESTPSDAIMTLARALAVVLQHWADASMLGMRASRIKAALKAAQAASEPLAHLEAVIREKLDAEHLAYVTPLMEELRKHVPQVR